MNPIHLGCLAPEVNHVRLRGPFSGSVGFGNANLGSGKTVTNFQFVNDKLDAFQTGSPN